MRGLSQQFMGDLCDGRLALLRKRVLADQSLCLEIRENYINIYYRGGNLLKVAMLLPDYEAFFDTKYAGEKSDVLAKQLPKALMRNEADVERWLEKIPILKQTMDIFLGNHPKEEREAQQSILRDNNFGGTSRATDFYVCDIEYANPHGRFDLVAVHWASNPKTRKEQNGHRLVLVEAKYGDGAMANKSGIASHVTDINRFLGDADNVQALKREMVGIFNQKRALGLMNCGRDLGAFSDEPPMLLLALINHDPDSSKLHSSLAALPPSPHAELCIATGCFMGYGLFDQAVVPIDEARSSLGKYFWSGDV